MRLGDFLPVGTDVLYGRAADTAGNAAQAFDASAMRHHRVGDELIPGFAGAGVEENFAVFIVAATWAWSIP